MKEEYCRNHCFARTVRRAVARLSIRLVNQSPFTQTSERATAKDVSA
jgi:hypothetical protein